MDQKTSEMLLQLLYARIPEKPGCPSGCHKCCGPVAMTKTEARLIGLPDGRQHTLAKGEFGDTCEFVDDQTGRCSIYEKRPMICRFFNSPYAGVFKCFETPHSCGLHPGKAGDLLDDYFHFVELEGYVNEFMQAHQLTVSVMAKRESRMGWDARAFGVRTAN